ncbi:MAG: DJ-1/PfpI family protein, partial [Gammaproteobacteria bacterium]|nr:DJ-1/PfpI family protein [Gammaproteobacteria bacterium]
MSHVLVPLAQGCEELEAITITDLLVRAGIKVTTCGLDEHPVKASRGITILPDTSIDKVLDNTYDLIVLPGGL